MSAGTRALLVLALALAVAACGGSDDAKDTASSTDAAPGNPVPETVPEESLPPIQITKPASFENAKDELTVAGTAQVSEGTLRYAVLDAKGRSFVEGTMEASCGAPCRGDFSATVSLAKVDVGSWELHVWAPNAGADAAGADERLHDAFVPITVVDRIDEDAPAPDAPPPGGVPTG